MFARGASANARGLLPDADQGIFFRHSESTQFGGAKTRLTIAQELLGGTYAAVLQTSSVGNTRTFFYTSISAEMDDVIFVSQLLHTQSQSNAGNQDSRPQAWAKNIVSGGAINHFNTPSRNDDTFLAANCGNFFGGTSTGPAQDGRIKPDLSFFYDCTVAAANSSNTAYTQFGGTSGATPSVAGYMGLFHQMWHENTWEGSGRLDNTVAGHTVFNDRPSPMLPKAALINTAFRYDWNSGGANGSLTRFVQGWGMPNLQTLYDARDKTYYADEPFILRQGQSKSHTINVAAGEPQLNVTMAYLDPMGTTSAATHRINDVSLRVTSPGGTVYWGNNGLTTGNASTSGGSSNTKDTVENVFIANPDAGKWTVEILGDVVVQDAHVETAATDVDYALWVTGGTESGSIKTTFRGGNGNAGAMFDITAHEDITISGFDIQHTATVSITIEVYSVAGGFAGNETNPAAWTLMGSQILTPNGEGAATHVSIGGLSIAAGQTFGLYVTDTAGAGFMRYTNGRETWDNGEVAISTGVGKFYPFGGTSLGRSWNGVVYYDLLAAGVGPYAFSIQSNGDDQLYRIDLTTGSTQSMGAAMGLNDAEGLTMMPNGTLLAIGGSVDELWNVTSPPGSFIGATGSRTGSDAGLDYSEAGSALYNLNAGLGASSLYRVNPNNGAIALIGNSTISADNIAIDKNANAYAIDGGVT
ncbi:MAG: S8 family serine peptidase, partial [Chloroflexi bacterium]|nr:S8 family serine peptidase [Chloroflexota bacterium]